MFRFQLKLDLIRIDVWEGTDILEIFIDGSATSVYNVAASSDGSAICGVAGENDKEISIDLNIVHSTASLVIAFKTNFDQTNLLESWGIRNYKLYLETNCLASCLTCSSLTPTNCLSCPNIAEKSFVFGEEAVYLNPSTVVGWDWEYGPITYGCDTK